MFIKKNVSSKKTVQDSFNDAATTLKYSYI